MAFRLPGHSLWGCHHFFKGILQSSNTRWVLRSHGHKPISPPGSQILNTHFHPVPGAREAARESCVSAQVYFFLVQTVQEPKRTNKERAGDKRAWVTVPTATAQEKHRWGSEERRRRKAGERDAINFACYILKCTSVRSVFHNQTPVQIFNFAIRNFHWPMPTEVPGTYWVLPKSLLQSDWMYTANEEKTLRVFKWKIQWALLLPGTMKMWKLCWNCCSWLLGDDHHPVTLTQNDLRHAVSQRKSQGQKGPV